MKALFQPTERVLIVAAHPDDETLGMGGSIHRLSQSGCAIRVVFMSDGISSRDTKRESLEERQKASLSALLELGVDDIHFSSNPDNKLDTLPSLELAKQIENHVFAFKPSLVFTHFPLDLNIDHKLVSEATQVACRPKVSASVKALLFFEVPSSTNWYFGVEQFSPNYYIDISQDWNYKEKALAAYSVEMNEYPDARSIENLHNLSKFRGAFMGILAAEAFQIAYVKE
jgi:LmbE family N-acetylglucosaminyl deacetylase